MNKKELLSRLQMSYWNYIREMEKYSIKNKDNPKLRVWYQAKAEATMQAIKQVKQLEESK